MPLFHGDCFFFFDLQRNGAIGRPDLPVSLCCTSGCTRTRAQPRLTWVRAFASIPANAGAAFTVLPVAALPARTAEPQAEAEGLWFILFYFYLFIKCRAIFLPHGTGMQ